LPRQVHQELSGNTVKVDTGKLKLVYQRGANRTGFTATNLASRSSWTARPLLEPRTALDRQSSGNNAYVDGARGAEHLKEAIGEGLISRDGWAWWMTPGRY